MIDAWKLLVKRYANGRTVCNCGEAYYSTGGTYWLSGSNKEFHDGLYCKNGCEANQYAAKNDVAERALRELGVELPPNDYIPYQP